MKKSLLIVAGIWFVVVTAYSQSVNYTYSQAEKLLNDKKYDQAIEKFRFVVKKDPYFYEAYYGAGLAYLYKKDKKNAYEYFGKAITANSNYSEAYEQHYKLAFELGNYQEAVSDLSNLIRLHPQKTVYYEKRAEAYEKLNKPDKALVDYRRAADLGSPNPKVYYKVAMDYKSKKDDANFLKYIDKAIEKDPSFADALYERGYYYYGKRKFGKAIQDFGKIYSENPDYNNDVILMLADSYAASGKCDKAVLFYDTYVKKTHSRNPDIFVRKGKCLHKQKKMREAIASFNKAIAYDAKNVEAYVERALVYDETGKEKMAERDFTKAISLDKKNPLPYFKRGLLKFNKHKYKDALEDFNLAVKYSKKSTPAEYFYYRGACYFNAGDVNKACMDLKKAETMGYKPAAKQRQEICL